MTIHDEMAETFNLARPKRPAVVRLVHVESGQVAREFDPAEFDCLTAPEIRAWAKWLQEKCGPDYEVETA